jgi:hypothetical protein
MLERLRRAAPTLARVRKRSQPIKLEFIEVQLTRLAAPGFQYQPVETIAFK